MILRGIAIFLLLLVLSSATARAVDLDGNGIRDELDNCPRVPNGSREAGRADADGIGEACECGDFTRDGLVDTADAPSGNGRC